MKIVNKAVKMAQKASKWRDSASLIILTKDHTKSKASPDYKVLLFSRSAKSSFMPMNSVFPGGVREPADESSLWLKYFNNIGLREQYLRNLIIKRDPNMQPQPNMFRTEKGDHLHRDISLRITAIRETFEEMGILLCRSCDSVLEDNNGFGTYVEDFDREKWQKLVHNDASEFLNLCKELNVVPDLWSLNEWSVWLTPAVFNKRFETVFYLVVLRDTPHVILETNEATDFKWLSPKDALIENMNGNIWLAPPQVLELCRLLNFEDICEVQKFASQRALKGTILMLPVQQQCTDGMVSLLPGDSKYPSEPNTLTDLTSIGMTKEQYRCGVEKLHRYEGKNFNLGVFYVNFEPIDGHLKPINMSNVYEKGKL